MNNQSKTILNEKDIKSLADLAPVNIDNLIMRIKNKPVIESKAELKNKVLAKLADLKALEKSIRLQNNQVHQIKNRANQSEEHIKAKQARDQMLIDKSKLVKEISLMEKRFNVQHDCMKVLEKAMNGQTKLNNSEKILQKEIERNEKALAYLKNILNL